MRRTARRLPPRSAPLPLRSLRAAAAAAAAAIPILVAIPPPAAADADPAALLAEIRTARLEPDRAVEVGPLKINTGLAVLEVERGWLFPSTAVGGAVAEVVFEGKARLHLEPPNDVEAGQLELFAGAASVDVPVTEAALVVASDAASQAFFRRPPATGISPEIRAKAEARFTAWRGSAERRLLAVEEALLADALGDPLYQTYFAGWFASEELGELLYLVDPPSPEAVTLGHFSPLEATEKERRKLERAINRTQRKGRLIGLTVDDLGQWDTWLSAPLGGGVGDRPWLGPFEPASYTLDLSLAERTLDLTGRAAIELVAVRGDTRVVRLAINSDLAVRAVRAGGIDLYFDQTGSDVLVVLPEAPAEGAKVTVELDYGGHLIEKTASGTFLLADTLNWYPRAGELNLATYDATFHWPGKFDLLAGGRRVDGGEEAGGRRWERRVVEVKTGGFSFEVGKFRTFAAQAGHVAVTLAIDADAYSSLKGDREELLTTVTDSLAYFEGVFGPYPLDELVVVTTPRPFSQATLGFVTLSDLMMSDFDLVTILLGLEDRRTVIAHEIAHQWWGHLVGWASYRDQWISEAMANYAATLYGRNRLGGELRFAIGPTTGWQTALLATTDDGRPIESLGPLVLGERLLSSRSGDAYQAIVYKKGAVVLDMLSRLFGEETFLKLLRAVVETSSYRVVSTETFFKLLAQASGANLDAFTRKFVFGTGLPEVYYDYSFAKGEGGKWKIHVTAEQRSPYRFRHRVVARPGGGLDVAREVVSQMEVDDSLLAVPMQIAVVNPDPKAKQEATLNGRLLLEGERTVQDFPIDYEPVELWLDKKREVYGRFFNRRRSPKRMSYFDGLDLAAAGRAEEAEAALRRALAAETFAGARRDLLDEDDIESEGRRLDIAIQLSLARLYLDAGRDADARAALAAAEGRVKRSGRDAFERQAKVVEARLALHAGDAETAFKVLRKAVLRRGDVDSTEGYLLLAIAARATGNQEELRTALDAVADKGADTALLTAPAGSPGGSHQ